MPEFNKDFRGHTSIDVLKRKTRNISTSSLIALLLIEGTFSRFVNQINLLHRIIFYVFKIHFNIVLLLTPRSVKESLSGFRLPELQNIGDTYLIVLVYNWVNFPLFTSLLQYDTVNDYSLHRVSTCYHQARIKE